MVTLAWRRPSPGLAAVLALSAVCTLGVLAAWLWAPPAAMPPSGTPVPWPLLAVVFGLTEVFVLHLHVRRQRRSVSLSELPLLLGLFGCGPLWLLVARLVGIAPALVLHRKQTGTKLVFNLSVLAAETTVAVYVFTALAPGSHGTGPGAWAAAYAAAVIASVLSHLAVSLVIAAHSRTLARGELLGATVSGVAAALAVSTLGLVAVTSLANQPAAGLLLGLVAALVVLGYRAYARLNERHLELERLYRFSQVVSSSPEVDELLRSVLVQAKELLRTEWAEVVFLSGTSGSGGGVRVALGPSDRLERTAVDDLAVSEPLWAKVVGSGAPLVADGNATDPSVLDFLASRGHRTAALVPLRGEAGVVGALGVADRLGETGSFDRGDVALLQTVGDAAGSALHKGQQLDELRQEALHDGLTGLPNRALLRRRMDALELDLAAGRIDGFGVLLLDLDGFKAVNDTLGHDRGDVLLCDVASRLVAAVPDGGTVARLGGDEFAVLLPGTTVAEARRAAEVLLAAVRHEVEDETDGRRLPVGTSVGIALVPHHGTDGSAALRCADAAMYVAKRSGTGAAMAGDLPDGIVPAARDAATAPATEATR